MGLRELCWSGNNGDTPQDELPLALFVGDKGGLCWSGGNGSTLQDRCPLALFVGHR